VTKNSTGGKHGLTRLKFGYTESVVEVRMTAYESDADLVK